MHMDGVPGITQCPIAPEDHFIYSFDTRQYGSAWYHSHYSVQYADGLLGPLTIYGPHSSNWDLAKYPLLMNDWFHNSAYSVIHKKIPGYPTILLNGTGNITNYEYTIPDITGKKPGDPLRVDPKKVPPPYRLHFEPERPQPPSWWGEKPKPKRYLLNLINASFGTSFIFSIDHHKLEVISADFVPVEPFNTTHLHIGIGQRYSVIVTAEPENYPDGTMANGRKLYWIRTTATGCFQLRGAMGSIKDYDRTGILSYYDGSQGAYEPKAQLPDTKPWPQIEGDTRCRDEPREKFKPMLKWQVEPPANKEKDHTLQSIEGVEEWKPSEDFGERFDVVGKFMLTGKPSAKFRPKFPVALFSFERTSGDQDTFEPMQINYSQPIFLELNRTEPWPKDWAVVNETEGITDDSWVGTRSTVSLSFADY